MPRFGLGRPLASTVTALALSLSSLLLPAAPLSAANTATAPQTGAPESVIVVLRDSAGDPNAVAADHARRHNAQVGHVYVAALRGYAATIPAQARDGIAHDPRVAFISADREVHITGQTVPTGVKRIGGDLNTTRSGDGTGSVATAVAIIDTGIDTQHPDLNVVGGTNCSTGRSYTDGNGHGTHVAGTVAAKDNANGVVGVAPGAPLYAVRVLSNSGSGSWSSVICGIDWVTANGSTLGIKVANMSLGGGGSDDGNCGNSNNDALHRAICGSVAKGITYVVAAGNDGVNLAGFVPAAYDEVLTVTAMADFNGQSGGGAPATCRTDVDETAADFSNFTTVGSADADHTIAAPGVCINSTWKGSGYNTISGTSMASPHVSGAVALCLAGPCAGKLPGQIISQLRGDAAAQLATYGFQGDPSRPIGSRYYGHLVVASGY